MMLNQLESFAVAGILAPAVPVVKGWQPLLFAEHTIDEGVFI